jgi:PIN domain nuclease of toxin-antitoxin system
MNLLLDTHILLWAIYAPERLPEKTCPTLIDPDNTVYFSSASLWEIAIKTSLGKPDFKVDAGTSLQLALKTGFVELLLSARVAVGVQSLLWLHRDPFDRLLVSQALALPARLLTADAALIAYSPLVECLC